MTTGFTMAGLLFLIVAWGSIIAVTIFCFKRVLMTRDKKDSTE